jgi:DNA-binding NarL/FixJ family response regulator
MSRHPCIAVVDEREFRRAGLMKLLEPWATVEKIRIVSFNPTQIEEWIEGNFEFKMLVFGIGGDLLIESKTLQILEMLRNRVPNTPVVVISDREDDHDVALAMSKDIQGYIFSGINSALAFQALSFILHGGVYFPPCALRRLQLEANENIRNQNSSVGTETPKRQSRVISVTQDASASIVPNDGGDEFIWTMLTARQKQVLEHIRQGESNKVIARHLGMTEGTVKVHVRQIMRKVGASNRTQLAIGKGAHLKKVET